MYSSRFRTKPTLLKKKKKPKHSAKACSDFSRQGRTSRKSKEGERPGGRKAEEEGQAVGPRLTGMGEVTRFSQGKHCLPGSEDLRASSDDPLLDTELYLTVPSTHPLMRVPGPSLYPAASCQHIQHSGSSLNTFQGLLGWEVLN